MNHDFSFAVLAALIVVTACKPASSPVDPGYLEEIQSWRAERLAGLTAPDGWLTLVGLHWLEEGENSVGSDPSSTVYLEADGIAPRIATIRFEGDAATLVPEPDAEIRIDGVAVTGPHPLRTDAADGGPDVLEIGRLRTYLIRRGDRTAVRVKNPEAPTLADFQGLGYFPVDPRFRVEATLEAFSEPRDVAIATAVGTEEHMFCPGVLRFSIDGRKLTLQPWIDQPDDRDLFIVFTDETSGKSTYGAGRFLNAELTNDGRAVLDFNRAYTPPCGFTPYATCPLAPPENALPIAVEAGEKHGGH